MTTRTVFLGESTRPSRNARYVTASGAALLVWYGLNFWPRWGSLPFLTDNMVEVLGILNIWLLAVAGTSALYIVLDRAWFKAALQAATATVWVAVLIQFYAVYPFDFTRILRVDADGIASTLLAVAVGAGLVRVAILAIRFVRAAARTIDDVRFAREVKTAMEARTQVVATVSESVLDGILAAALRPTQGELGETAHTSTARKAARQAAAHHGRRRARASDGGAVRPRSGPRRRAHAAD